VASGARDVRTKVPGARELQAFRAVPGLTVVEVADGETQAAIAALHGDPDIEYAEPDYRVEMFGGPNDPSFDQLWGLHNTGQVVNADPGVPGKDIRAFEAWDLWTGATDFRVAVIDTGINYQHADLDNNMWINPGEIPLNLIDDDGNGWVDDVFGYNFYTDTWDPLDNVGHGSHIAGTIGAAGNNGIGVVGINWRCRLVALKFADEGGGGFISDAIEAIEYVIDNDIKVSNNSWGCYQCFTQSLYDAIAATQAIGHIFVAASGNGIFGLGVDCDRFPAFPASFDLPNIISVAAIDNDGLKAKFSNFGRASVDIGAPGVNVYSTVIPEGYDYYHGTSMAAPHVTGVVALMRSRLPQLSANEVVTRIMGTARPEATLAGITVTGGVLDALGALGDCNENGVFDEMDIASGESRDCNTNGIPDECEPDCNNNNRADECDISRGLSPDCDDNGVPDECQPDCNENERADICDIAFGNSDDCNRNGFPDECEIGHDQDCNKNTMPDLCDIHEEISTDCNENYIPDECDISGGKSEDCSGNGLPDECERDCNANDEPDSCDILAGLSQDVNQDGVPDECSIGFALVPVGTKGSSLINGQEIEIVEGGETITFEIRLSGWDPDQDGTPRLRLFQAGIDSTGFTTGERGSLSLARIPCAVDTECLGESHCEADGFCDAIGSLVTDEAHPDWVFSGIPAIVLTDISRTRFGSTLFDSAHAVRDEGVARYTGTLILDVSKDAVGTFTIGFAPEESFIGDDAKPTNLIEAPGLLPAIVIVRPDCNDNGQADGQDIVEGISVDCDLNGVPDECVPEESDCNGNHIPDVCDTRDGSSPDCNGNSIPDECIEREEDCNENLLPDACDIKSGSSDDCNGNDIPDECLGMEIDCNHNRIPDACDIADGTAQDCDTNGIPDRCEDDCNDNGLEDACDIADGESEDIDDNDIPDECQSFLRVPEDYSTIQQAIDAAVDGDIVLLSPGVHRGTGNVNVDFRGKSVILRCVPHAGECMIDATGQQAALKFDRGEGRNARVEDITIAHAFDAGIICTNSSRPVIRRCVIRNNGPLHGGVWLEQNSNALIEDCHISNNHTGFSGGGIRAMDSSPTILRCVFSENSAADRGGAVYTFGGDLTIAQCTFMDNAAHVGGGAIALENGASIIHGCRMSGNVADPPNGSGGDGGALHLLRTQASVSSCLMDDNFANNRGGGIYLDGGDPAITNATIVGNQAQVSGGGVYQGGAGNQTGACCYIGDCDSGLTRLECTNLAGSWYPGVGCATVVCGSRSCCMPNGACQNRTSLNCLVAGGIPKADGSQCATYDCTPTLRNMILWENRAGAGANLRTNAPFLTVADSTVQGGWLAGENVESIDPDFVVPGEWVQSNEWLDGDYHLLFGSSAVDFGADAWLSASGMTDLDGRPRSLCAAVDRGAYENGIGDYDCNGLVGLNDYASWSGCFTGSAAAALVEECQAFDFDADSDIDLRDFAEFQIVVGQ